MEPMSLKEVEKILSELTNDGFIDHRINSEGKDEYQISRKGREEFKIGVNLDWW